MEAQCQRLEVRSKDGDKVLFTASEEEVVMTTKQFTVTGKNVILKTYFDVSISTPAEVVYTKCRLSGLQQGFSGLL